MVCKLPSTSALEDLLVETDALLVQQELSAADPFDRPEGGLVEEMKSLVSSNFIRFECMFRNRDVIRWPMPWRLWVMSVLKGTRLSLPLFRVMFM
jgi:hypothetical protein